MSFAPISLFPNYSVAMASTVRNNPEVQQRISRPKVLTARARNYIKKGVKLGERVCCHPYVWDDVKGYPEYTTSRLQIMGWVFNFVLSTGYLIFLLVQCVLVNKSPDETTSVKAFIIFAAVLFSFPFFFHVTILVAGEQLPSYVRCYFQYCQDFEENYVRESARPSAPAKIGGIILTYVYYVFPLDAALFTLYGVTRLNTPEQVSSMISADYPLVQIPVCIGFCIYFYGCYAANGFAIIFTSFGFLFASFDVLKEIGKGDSSFTTEDFQRPQDRLRAYRVIQLLTDVTDHVYWVVTIAAQYVLMLLAMFGTYGAMRLDGLPGIAMGVLGASTTIILVVFLSAWAEFYSRALNAREFLRTMTTRADVLEDEKLRTWLRKSVKSLRVARLSVGGWYYIDKELVMSAIGIISDGIFFLLESYAAMSYHTNFHASDKVKYAPSSRWSFQRESMRRVCNYVTDFSSFNRFS